MDRLPYAAKVPIWKRMGYMPSDEQMRIHRDLSNIFLIAGGWRAGKSIVIAAEATPHCLVPSDRPYLGALIGPTYEEPRAEFDYMVEFLTNALPPEQFDVERDVSRPQQGPCTFTIRGKDGVYFATVKTWTAHEAETVRSFNADFVVICEAGGISEDSFEAIMGRTLSTGGFIIGSGTMEESQKWYHNKIKTGLNESAGGVKSALLPSWANRVAFPGGREDPKILRLEEAMRPERFRVRIGAEPIRIEGIALPELTREAHVRDVEFDPRLPVELAVDPGYTGGYAVLAIQIYENEIRIIDEVYTRFKATVQVIELCKEREWWGNVDADNPGVFDRAAKQKQAVTGVSVLDKWYEETGLWFDITEQVIPVADGLDQIRNHAMIPGHIVISPKAQGLLAECDLGDFPEGFDGYSPWHYKKNKGTGQLTGDNALAGADHSCTALEYWLVTRYGFITMDELTDFGPHPLRPMRMPETHDDNYGHEQMTRTVGA